MRLVEAWPHAGWTVAAACRLVGFSRSGYYVARQARPDSGPALDPSDQALLGRIRAVAEAHPFWGVPAGVGLAAGSGKPPGQ
ncbi:hypothetical protein [Nitrospira sp. Kam-Ns4a]